MKKIFTYILLALFLAASPSIYSQRDVEKGSDTTKKEQEVLKEFKKEQEKYEKEHGKTTPKNRQDPNPKPTVKANDKIEKKKEIEEKKDALDEEKYKLKEKEVDNSQGNAYGKNKEGLSGREFGLSRAEDARNKINTVQSNFDDKQQFIVNSQKRIDISKKRLEEAKTNGELSDLEYSEGLRKISNAQNKMDSLTKTIRLSQERLKNLRLELNSIYKNNDQL